MAAADAVVCQSFRIQIAVASAQQARGFALYLIGQIIRLFRVPSDGCLFTDNADAETKLLTGIDTARPDIANRAVVIFHDGHGVVLQLSALYERLLGAHQSLDVQLRTNRLGQVQHMGADIAHRERRTCLFRVNAPSLRCRVLFYGYVVAAVCKLHVDDADFAQIAACNHLARLLDHLVTGIAVGYKHNLAGFLDQRFQLLCLLDGEAQRLLTVYMQTGLQCRLGNFIMGKVRGCDGNGLNAVRTLCLSLEHALVIGVAAVCGYMAVFAEFDAALRHDVERTCYQLKVKVSQSSGAVNVANLAAAAAADHAPTNRLIYVLFSEDHNEFLLISCCSLVFLVVHSIQCIGYFAFRIPARLSRKSGGFLNGFSCGLQILAHVLAYRESVIPLPPAGGKGVTGESL